MEHLSSYRIELQTLGYSENGIYSRLQAIKNCIRFTVKEQKNIQSKDIRNYFTHLQLKGLHSSTIQHYYHDIQQYFIWLEREKHINKNPFNRYDLHIKKQQKTSYAIVSQEEIKHLYKACNTLQETVIIHLCYGCGLRALELQRINIEDINLNNQTLIVQKGKNNKRRTIPLNTRLTADIQQYLEQRKQAETSDTKALLLNKKEVRLKHYTARTILHQIVKRANINKRITLHGLRHSIATHLLENGVSIEKVSLFLGHSQLETTEIYTRVNKKQLKTIMNNQQ